MNKFRRFRPFYINRLRFVELILTAIISEKIIHQKHHLYLFYRYFHLEWEG